jgi:hypothetical protein
MTRVLDADPELTRLGRTSGFALWRLLTPGGRLMLVDGQTVTALPVGEGATRVRVPPGADGRTLLLAEPADGGWHATINGAEAEARTVDGWAQGYAVPTGGGEFVLTRGTLLRHGWVLLQAAGVLVVGILALPGAQAEAGAMPTRRRRRGLRHRQARDAADAAVDIAVDAAVDAVARLRRRAGTRRAADGVAPEPVARTVAPTPAEPAESGREARQ